MRSMKKLGTAVAAASAMMALFGAGSASAANWDPPNTTLTAHGTLSLTAAPFAATVSCTYHSGVRSAGGADAFTTETNGTVAAPPTFSGCTSTFGTVESVVAHQPWTITATSTTAVNVTNGNATIVLSVLGITCTITAENVSVGATWNNTTKTLSPASTPFSVTKTAACPHITTGSMTGSVTVPGANLT
jgi:hypothetical protein